MRRAAGLACTLLLAACGGESADTAPVPAPAASAPAPAAPVPVPAAALAPARYDGYGDVRFGMDEQAFALAWQGTLKRLGPPGEACFYQVPQGVDTPSDFAFMFEGGHFVRYDVGTPGQAAPGGGAVGMDAARIQSLYDGRVSVLPHKYVPGAKVLRVIAPRGAGVLVFETDAQGRVTRWRAGVSPQVDYVEGCS